MPERGPDAQVVAKGACGAEVLILEGEDAWTASLAWTNVAAPFPGMTLWKWTHQGWLPLEPPQPVPEFQAKHGLMPCGSRGGGA